MKIVISSLFFCLLPLLAWAELPQVIKVCDDGEEWPPYVFYERSGGKKTHNVVGYSVDFLKELLASKKFNSRLISSLGPSA